MKLVRSYNGHYQTEDLKYKVSFRFGAWYVEEVVPGKAKAKRLGSARTLREAKEILNNLS